MLAATLILSLISALIIAPNIVAIILGLAIPVATELVTRIDASILGFSSATIKRAVTGIIAAVVVLITNNMVTDGSAVISGQTLFSWALATITATLSYLGLWRKLGLKGALLPGFGIGKKG